MATGTDQAVGYGFMFIAATVFVYYTLWVVILPFVEDDHFIHNYFLPSIYAVTVPITAGVVVLIGLVAFIAYTMLQSQRNQKKKS